MVTPVSASSRVATRWASRSATLWTVRCLPVSLITDFTGHVLFAGAFGTLGYWLHGVKVSQQELLERKQKELSERRLA